MKRNVPIFLSNCSTMPQDIGLANNTLNCLSPLGFCFSQTWLVCLPLHNFTTVEIGAKLSSHLWCD